MKVVKKEIIFARMHNKVQKRELSVLSYPHAQC